jgi:lactoylglutathione lyase
MPKVCVVQVNVADMDVAIDFYASKLGFLILDESHRPYVVVLDSGIGVPFVLNKVDQATTIDYPRVAQSMLNFSTDDLTATMNDLKQRGVNFIHHEPQACPVGVYAAFTDPFGNVHEFLEIRR